MSSSSIAATDLATLASEIDDLHARATEAARTTVDHARECGELLIAAKGRVGHGEFAAWREANCQVQARQAQGYMKLAREWESIESKSAPGAHLTIAGAMGLLESNENPKQDEGGRSEDERETEAEGVNEDAGTDATRMDAPPPPDRERRTDGGGVSSSKPDTPRRDPVALQRAKTVKTAEALMRAFDDLQELQFDPNYDDISVTCVDLVTQAKAWG